MPRYSIIEDELVFKLIEEVKKRKCLFSSNGSSGEQPADRLSVLKGWADVAHEVGKPVTVVRQKWKSLRDMFWKEVRRCGAPQTYFGKWRFFRHLTFVYKARTTPDSGGEGSERGDPEYLEEEADIVCNFIKTEKREDPLQSLKREDAMSKKRLKQDSTQEDFDAMFLNSLTPFFNQLEPLRKLVVRNNIQDMLLHELSAQMCTSTNDKEFST